MSILDRTAIAFEVDKARTMARNHVLLALAVVFSIGPLILGAYYYRQNELGDRPVPLSEFDAVALGNSQLINFGSLLLALLGILLVGYEFRGRTEVGTLLAVPNRLRSYASKLMVGGVVALAFAAVLVPVCFVITQSILGEPHAVGLADEGVMRSLVGAVVSVVLITLFAMGLATSLRSTALAIGILMPMMFIISTLLRNIPVKLVSTVAEFLPDQAGGRMAQAYTPDHVTVGPYGAVIVLAAWTVAAIVTGGVRLQRTDATGE